jgi:hypothetical protein
LLELRVVATGDDQVIDVDVNNQSSNAYSPSVHGVLSFAALEPMLRQRDVQLSVPGARCLTQTIQCLIQVQYLVLYFVDDEPRRLFHEHLLLKIPI